MPTIRQLAKLLRLYHRVTCISRTHCQTDSLCRREERASFGGSAVESKLLFVGSSGCGKNFTAQAIANELQLPRYIVRFGAVIGAYLGQTAIRLKELFRFASATPCVLLFDEIDAIGKQLDDDTFCG